MSYQAKQRHFFMRWVASVAIYSSVHALKQNHAHLVFSDTDVSTLAHNPVERTWNDRTDGASREDSQRFQKSS